ncbi:MAG: hypothetical protein NZM28_00010 [Fimbriimonadales bacterium]|nr:hypothetical protein [Fimbriimonadales bacterium]
MSGAKIVYEATGTTDDGATIVLESPVPLRGRVKVHIEAERSPARQEQATQDLWSFLEQIHAEQRARGYQPRSPEEIEAYIRELRHEDDDETSLP